ncbi:MAG: hypothetical protein IJA89_05010 [Clostridia bacterium]|nr:hypothetical protein [Clostridia bacterium]
MKLSEYPHVFLWYTKKLGTCSHFDWVLGYESQEDFAMCEQNFHQADIKE